MRHTLEGRIPNRYLLVGIVISLMLFLPCRERYGLTVSAQSIDHPVLELKEFRSKVFENTRQIRVLLPSGYYQPENAGKSYPVFYFTDGIAVFDRAGRDLPGTVARLKSVPEIAGTIFVGLDNGGATKESKNPPRDRADEYLPYPDAPQSWTPPLDKPRGRLFPQFLADEVMPLINRLYRTKTGPANTGLAGSSYGGTIALYTIKERPGLIGRLMLESPALHISRQRLLKESRKIDVWPSAVFIGAGTEEGATEQIQAELIKLVRELGGIIRLKAPATRLCLKIVDHAKHDESAWRARLPDGLAFLIQNHPCN